MKKHILLAVLIVSLVACKGTKKATSISKSTNSVSTVSKENNVKKHDATKTMSTNADNSNAPGGVISQTSGSTGGMDNMQMSPTINSSVSDSDLTKMFGDLQMTKDQIQTYNNSMAAYKKSVISQPNGEMLGTIGNEQDRQLKKILTENQWNKYLAWKKSRK